MKVSTQEGYQPYVASASTDQVSAPLFVVLAYSTIWLVLLLFVLSVWWRQKKVNDEIQQLQQLLDADHERQAAERLSTTEKQSITLDPTHL